MLKSALGLFILLLSRFYVTRKNIGIFPAKMTSKVMIFM